MKKNDELNIPLDQVELMNKDTGNMEKFISKENVRRDGVLDPNLICCEIYNLGKETITFKNMIQTWLPDIICRPDDWCFLPHQYFTGSVPSGSEEIKVIKNYGDQKFKGNKLPSRPEAKLR